MVTEMGEEEQKKKPLELNWGEIFSKKENGAPPEVVVVPKEDQQEMESISKISDYELEEKINRVKGNLFTLSAKLPDNGEKLRRSLRTWEEELKRRNQFRSTKEAECEKAKQSRRSCSPGACNGFSSQAPSPQNHIQSKFTKSFSQVLDDKPDMSTRISVNQHNKELRLGGGNHQSTESNGRLVKRDGQDSKASLKILPLRKASNREGYEHRSPVGERKTIDSSSFYNSHQDERYSSLMTKRRKASPDQTSHRTRTTTRRQACVKKQSETVVLLDEEDCQMTEATHHEVESNERMEDKIYYPSRDDPECVELDFSDINCLAPEVYLSSPIMNFYIRYLQMPSRSSRSDYLIFNTYFYGKIKEAVLCKEMDKVTFFSKFRRWWKGVNIFEKAYILFPIHEHFHWSLVIICQPDKEDESGPLVLHLDSLGYHVSTHIFSNVKSFLSLEWNYLKQKEASMDLPMAENVWKRLSRRITDKRITVPQQKNDYDCGVFVLFFMECFIKQAPPRLRRDDHLEMFGREWFKPEEASRLRKRIRKLLKKEFKKARENESREASLTFSENDSGASHNVDIIEDSMAECSVDLIEQLD